MPKSSLFSAFQLLDDFRRRLENRPDLFIILSEIFPKMLEWHFKAWEQEYTLLVRKDSKENLERWARYSELSRSLGTLLKDLEVRVLRSNHGAYEFLKALEGHVDVHKEAVISNQNKKHSYLDSLFSQLYSVFFEEVGKSPQGYDIWEHYFPAKWKVTESNLQGETRIFSRIALLHFLQWAQRRIWNPVGDFDRALDDVSMNLFPEVEPITWSRILLFVYTPAADNRPQRVIEHTWNFGLGGRVYSYLSSDPSNQENFAEMADRSYKQQYESQVQATFALARLIFPHSFSPKQLGEYIRDLKKLKYPDGSKEEKKKLVLLGIFKGMQSYLKKG